MKKYSYIILLLVAVLCALCLTGCLSDTTDALEEEFFKQGITDDGFEFSIANKRAVLGRYTGLLTEVNVPSTIEGYPVKALDRTFEQNKKIVSIILPEGVEDIGSAFMGCSKLSNISLPEGIEKIPASAFEGCSSLSKIVLPSGVKEIEAGAFSDCTALAQIILPDGIRIGNGAFYNTAWLNNMTGDFIIIGNTLIDINTEDSHIDIPNNVREIRLNGVISNAESIFLPESVCDIGNLFYSANNLKSITVDANNLEYSAVDGVLYNKDKTILMHYPANKDEKVFEVDKNAKMIGYFPEWNEVETIILPEDFLTDFNSLAEILQGFKPMSQYNIIPRQDSTPEDYWFLAFQFVSANGGRKKSHSPYFKNLYFRGVAPSNVEEINAYLQKLDDTLNIVWGYEG